MSDDLKARVEAKIDADMALYALHRIARFSLAESRARAAWQATTGAPSKVALDRWHETMKELSIAVQTNLPAIAAVLAPLPSADVIPFPGQSPQNAMAIALAAIEESAT